jgi:hypothetical protein
VCTGIPHELPRLSCLGGKVSGTALTDDRESLC